MLTITTDLINDINSYFEENGFMNLHAEIKEVNKNNQIITGINTYDSIKQAGLIYYPDEDDDTAGKTARNIIKLIQNMPEVNKDEYFTKEYILKHVRPCIAATYKDNELNPILKDKTVFPRKCYDISTYYRIQIDNMNYIVTNELLDHVGLDVFDLELAATNNLMKIVKFKDMLGFIEELQYGENVSEDLPTNLLYVLTTEDKFQGAAAMLIQNNLEEIQKKIKCNFYILPSSVHEVIIVPDTDNQISSNKTEEFYKMVCEVNKTIDPNDKLTDSVYYYSQENGLEQIA